MGLTGDTTPQWSVYDITESNQEHELFQSFLVESCDIFGFDVDYFPLNPDFDAIYGEDKNLQYIGPYSTKVVYTPGDEPALYNTFGMYSDEVIEKIHIPKYTFTSDVSASGYIRPRIGDVIKATWNYNIFYEVTDVDEEDNIFQAKKFSLGLTMKPYRGSEDDNIIDATGLVDSIPISAAGDNVDIALESDEIDNYADILPSVREIYGFD